MGTNGVTAISLYRSILRAHKSLPEDMKVLGNAYVKSEFKLHKTVKDEQLTSFFSEWQTYLSHIRQTTRAQTLKQSGISNERGNERISRPIKFGTEIDKAIKMTDEQKLQLTKLREEALKSRK